MQVAVHAVLLFVQPPARLQEEGVARVLRNVQIRLVPVVVPRVLDEDRLELLLVNPSGLHSDLDKHLDDLLEVNALDHLAVPLLLDLGEEQGHEPLLDLAVEDDLRLELARLHRLHILVVLHLGHKVLVHVEQEVLDHDDYVLFEGPHVGDLFQQVLVGHRDQSCSDGLQHLDGGLLDVLVKHLPVLVEYQVVACTVQLLVGER
jgi:hypothetical protein